VTTGLRVHAVQAHSEQCPECAGLLRMSFQMAAPDAPVAAVDLPTVRPPQHTLRQRRHGANPRWAPAYER
jgi:hypothetical protein